MGRRGRAKTAHRTIAWAAVLFVHGVVALFVLQTESARERRDEPVQQFISIWLRPQDPPEPSIARAPPGKTGRADVRRASSPAPAGETPVQPQAVEPAPESPPRIDWYREAGKSATSEPAGRKRNTFSDPPVALHGACKPKKSSFKWNPNRFGMAGDPGQLRLPYVRLGDRCVIGLGFFGCALGPKPEVKGEILDDMRDPTRPTLGSVPEIDQECPPEVDEVTEEPAVAAPEN